MSTTMKLLAELQKNYDKVSECNKILKDGSYIYLLKKMKKEFNDMKQKFIEMEKENKEVKNNYIIIGNKIKCENDKLSENKRKLYNEAGSDLKLIASLQNKIEKNKDSIQGFEDESMNLIEKEEKLISEKEELRVKLINIKENFNNYKKLSSKKIDKAKEEITEAKKNISKIEPNVPPDVLAEFKRLIQINSTAVSYIHRGVCSGCSMKVSAMTIDSIYKGKGIVFCDNCGRILCYDDASSMKAVK